MTDNHRYNLFVIFALIIIVGLGFALALPWLANAQGFAAQSEVGSIANFKAFLIHGKEFKASPVESAQLVPNQEHDPEVMTRYYVAQTGDGKDPTEGWVKAAKNVQDALALANITGGGEIWVAAGVYYPDQGIVQIKDAVSSTFVLGEDVALYGGFDTGDTTFSDRDWEANLTVLSGDIDGNDTQTDGVVNNAADINGDNAYHVVSSSSVTGSTVIDGFTITAGQADSGSFPNDAGGGFYCEGHPTGNECSPRLSNIIFSGNYALNGGAMFNNGKMGNSSPSLTNVTFYGNYAVENGGALHNNGSYTGNSSPSLSSVTFSGNSVDGKGGAMYNNGNNNGNSSPSLKDVTFSGNSAAVHGGALYNDGETGTSSPSLEDVTFSGNSAGNNGGAMYNYGKQGDSNPTLINVTFSGNSADSSGGAMFNQGRDFGYSSPNLKNVVFSGNSAKYGGAIYNYVNNGTSFPFLSNVTFSGNSAGKDGGAMYNDGRSGGLSSALVRNSILWNNRDINGTGTISATIYNNSATTKLIHSIVQGSFPGGSWVGGSYVDGGGNIDENPIFVTDVELTTVPNTSGNLRLQTGSPAIDAGENAYVSVSFDLDNKARVVDGDLDGMPTVDMGAYETQIYYYLPLINR